MADRKPPQSAEELLERYAAGERDFRGADLRRADLRSADLSGVDLRDARLDGASLVGARLARANLTYASLRRTWFYNADLSEAELPGADLKEAQLHCTVLAGADLRKTFMCIADLHEAVLTGVHAAEADLCAAKLYSVDLRGADLERVIVGETVFANVDLSDVTGLGSVRHRTPSSVDHRTIERSGDLPLEFLRGCGLPDPIIDSYRGYAGGGMVKFFTCFISYSGSDEGFARRLYADLQERGVRCWFAPHDLRIGDSVRETIEGAIRVREKLILVLSESSIESEWVEHEVTTALDEEERMGRSVLFPIRLDDHVFEESLSWAKRIVDSKRPTGRHVGDFRKWKHQDAYKRAFDRLLRDLRATPETDENG